MANSAPSLANDFDTKIIEEFLATATQRLAGG
jgi:hypothetical protein